MNIDEKYLLRCIELGKNALGIAAPNPMVGSIIVHNDKIVGEGYTSVYGGAHAEVNAIQSVKDKASLTLSTLYVTLEPCSHYGKTPPCANLIIENQIPRVVIGITDPHIKIAGKGIEKLRNAGCKVIVGVLEKECREHHRRFLTFQEKKRPYIILKWAETMDGFIAPNASERNNGIEPFWISNTYSRQLVHQWRSEEQAILVGTNTVREDNPKLNIRDWTGKSPFRIVLDSNLSLPENAAVFNDSSKTMVIHDKNFQKKSPEHPVYEAIDFKQNVPEQICEVLFEHQIASVIIEGGLQTLQSFIDKSLWDEARIFKGVSQFKKGIEAPKISGNPLQTKTILTDTLTILRND
ncbi:bifunctional diaminohydroxyphosphoribosylaminopyrimidine deaminase/5-amino-6-(5-phosphoribosylamino)uracil reductase RibD [Croceitalea rosinachiae]|uniref:Riboflavin biosynthesis protein RibD n=1 Tax=Croceitalea rosinachiae TaxID=3075596 RepID=A0ABU3ADS0_9FLAO|nr:bifunctional diaminohydroxyphosphoribosylaminopyrimidine deaminase/5-amino-6-(5-phosphoribosylamino)uracil reductase RibD [Croceitalea sp. F388]MDT0607258.1 bifunctional diaminohydroxyphosphoribosylaminopyrimidine deaminase/5-amino-6-(5-phosphoribosylamino)uracil reductase RibD [Croceitalea sp. F388]